MEEAYEQTHKPITDSILTEAENIIHGKRQESYGDPERNYERIARFWSVYLEKEITAVDVCQMMILLKQARLISTPTHRDSIVDIAGYAALIEIINGSEK
jgi:hypothetical protein